MPLIDASYFHNPAVQLVVDGNEDLINACIETFEPEYLRAVMGESLYEAFLLGLATPTGVYFTNQYTDQYFKGTIADRWKWIRDGHVFTCNGRQLKWLGMQNVAKRSPVANYVYWMYLDGRNPSPSGTGTFTIPVMENAQVVSPYRNAMKAWNWMVDQNEILYAMITGLTDTAGAPLYPEFVRSELWTKDSVDVYNIQTLF